MTNRHRASTTPASTRPFHSLLEGDPTISTPLAASITMRVAGKLSTKLSPSTVVGSSPLTRRTRTTRAGFVRTIRRHVSVFSLSVFPVLVPILLGMGGNWPRRGGIVDKMKRWWLCWLSERVLHTQ